MHSIFLQSLLLAAFSSNVVANPHLVGRDWYLSRRNDIVRSPCPGLNVLANEGFMYGSYYNKFLLGLADSNPPEIRMESRLR
jgi:hypothetical protein